MKLYFYGETGAVIEKIEMRRDVDASKFIVTNEIPEYHPKNGFYGKLFVEEGKLVWHFIPIDPERELTNEEITQMFAEVL